MLYIIGVPIVLFAVGCLVWYLIGQYKVIDFSTLGDTDEDW